MGAEAKVEKPALQVIFTHLHTPCPWHLESGGHF